MVSNRPNFIMPVQNFGGHTLKFWGTHPRKIWGPKTAALFCCRCWFSWAAVSR